MDEGKLRFDPRETGMVFEEKVHFRKDVLTLDALMDPDEEINEAEEKAILAIENPTMINTSTGLEPVTEVVPIPDECVSVFIGYKGKGTEHHTESEKDEGWRYHFKDIEGRYVPVAGRKVNGAQVFTKEATWKDELRSYGECTDWVLYRSSRTGRWLVTNENDNIRANAAHLSFDALETGARAKQVTSWAAERKYRMAWRPVSFMEMTVQRKTDAEPGQSAKTDESPDSRKKSNLDAEAKSWLPKIRRQTGRAGSRETSGIADRHQTPVLAPSPPAEGEPKVRRENARVRRRPTRDGEFAAASEGAVGTETDGSVQRARISKRSKEYQA